MNSRQLNQRLMRYIAPYWEALVFALTGMMVMAATAPMLAALMEWMVDGAFINKDMEVMQLVLLGIIVLFIVRGAAGYISTYAISWVGSKLVVDLRVEMFDKLLVLPARYYADQPSGSLISKFRSDIDQLAHAFTGVVTVMVKDTLTVMGLLGWMFYLNWKLSVLALLVTSVIMLIMRSVNERLQRMGREARQTVDNITLVLKESIENHKVVKLYGGEHYRKPAYGRASEQNPQLCNEAGRDWGFHRSVGANDRRRYAGDHIIFATQQVSSDEITVGSFVSLMLTILMLGAPLKRVAGMNAQLKPGLAAAGSIFSFLDEIETDTGTSAIERAQGS